MILGVCFPVRDPDDTAHIFGGPRIEESQTENRIRLVRQAQREPSVLLLQPCLLLSDERIVAS